MRCYSFSAGDGRHKLPYFSVMAVTKRRISSQTKNEDCNSQCVSTQRSVGGGGLRPRERRQAIEQVIASATSTALKHINKGDQQPQKRA
jgi:hypothetical protein